MGPGSTTAMYWSVATTFVMIQLTTTATISAPVIRRWREIGSTSRPSRPARGSQVCLDPAFHLVWAIDGIACGRASERVRSTTRNPNRLTLVLCDDEPMFALFWDDLPYTRNDR
jgi:hypothetical protein